jgi:hypothetical protein
MSIIDINSRIIQSPSLGAGTYTLSAYVKVLNTTTAGSVRFAPTIDGGNVNSIFTPTTEWERYTQTFTVNTTFSSIAVRGLSGGFVGDIAIWGLQLVQGTDAKPYFATTNRQDVPRLDYRNADGSLNSCPRLLLEPQRTNSIRNSTMVGAVAGSPGTLPTNWTTTNGGLTRTIVGLGTENGLQYMDIRFNGTATSTTAFMPLEGTTSIAAATAQSWTHSAYFKQITSSPNSVTLAIIERTSVGGYVTEGGSSALSLTTSLSRFSFTRTLSGGATVAFAQPLVYFNLTNGAAYDFTIRIAAPQMELGAYATTFIPTTTAAVTRLGEIGSKTGVSSLIGQTQGTIFVDIQYNQTTSDLNGRFLNLWDTSDVTNSILPLIFGAGGSANQLQVGVYRNGTFSIPIAPSTSTLIPFGRQKIAIAYNNGVYTVYRNGSLFASGSGSAPASLSVIEFGNATSVPRSLGNPINQAALFTRRLTNAELAQITTL